MKVIAEKSDPRQVVSHLSQVRFTTACVAGALLLGLLSVPVYADRDLSSAVAQPATGIIDNSDPAWTWSGMSEISDPQFHGGTAHAGKAGTYGVYTFHGTSVNVIGLSGSTLLIEKRPRRLGSATVTIDEKTYPLVSLKSAEPDFQHSLLKVSGLPDGNHVIKIEASTDWIVIDDIVASTEAQPQAANTAGDPGKLYRIFPKSAVNKFLQTADVSLADSAAIEIGAADQSHSQIWRVVSVGNGCYRISPLNAPGQAMTLSHSVLTDESNKGQLNPIIIRKYAGATEQKWVIIPAVDKWYQIGSPSNPSLHFNVWNWDKFVVGYIRGNNGFDDNELWGFLPVAEPK